MSKFVVTETSFQYNDEYHYATEDKAGIPVAVFDTEEEANTYALNRTVKDFLRSYPGQNLSGYGYCISDIFCRRPSFLEMDDDSFFDDDSYCVIENMNIPNLNRKHLEEVARCLAIQPYRVTKIK